MWGSDPCFKSSKQQKCLHWQKMLQPREAHDLREGRFLSHFPPGLEHGAIIATAVISCTEIIHLVLSLEQADGQGGCVARPGARESVGDPRGSTGRTTYEDSGGRSWDLLVSVHIIACPTLLLLPEQVMETL